LPAPVVKRRGKVGRPRKLQPGEHGSSPRPPRRRRQRSQVPPAPPSSAGSDSAVVPGQQPREVAQRDAVATHGEDSSSTSPPLDAPAARGMEEEASSDNSVEAYCNSLVDPDGQPEGTPTETIFR